MFRARRRLQDRSIFLILHRYDSFAFVENYYKIYEKVPIYLGKVVFCMDITSKFYFNDIFISMPRFNFKMIEKLYPGGVFSTNE